MGNPQTKTYRRLLLTLSAFAFAIATYVWFVIETQENTALTTDRGEALRPEEIWDPHPKPPSEASTVRESQTVQEVESLPEPDPQPPADSIPDPSPDVYVNATYLEQYLKDTWLNPTQRSFSPEELAALKRWSSEDGLLAEQLGQEYLKKTDELGKDLLRSGDVSGEVNRSELSDEEWSKIPYMTKDWLRPVFFEFRGKQYRWVEIDLETQAPEIAEVWRQKQTEIAAARARLRDHIRSLP